MSDIQLIRNNSPVPLDEVEYLNLSGKLICKGQLFNLNCCTINVDDNGGDDDDGGGGIGSDVDDDNNNVDGDDHVVMFHAPEIIKPVSDLLARA